jgi:hypothetical protein
MKAFRLSNAVGDKNMWPKEKIMGKSPNFQPENILPR